MPRVPRTDSVRTLPPALETIFGRDEDVRNVVAMFEQGRRFVTLVGPGGIGKTQLAHAVARHLAPTFSGGAVLAELGEVRDFESLVRAVAKAAAVGPLPSSAFVPEQEPPCQAAVEFLAKRLGEGRRTLFLLDDTDFVVVGAGRVVRAALAAGNGACFLVTSREALGMEGERVLVVEPLARAAALAMFEDRVDGAAWKPEQLEALVDQLDGLPLAIELAARRSRLVSPGDLLARLGEVFRLLKTDRRDVAARHATLSATIEWSLSRLDVDESLAFSCLGVFAGSFLVEAFEAVVGPMLSSDPLDVAQALLRKSLVATVVTKGSARLTMLSVLRAFARERFAQLDSRDREAVEAKHAEFYVERAEIEARRLYGAGAEDALDALESDLPNLLRIFEREKAQTNGRAPRVLIALRDVVLFRNAVDLRSRMFEEARVAADANGDPTLRVCIRLLHAKVMLELATAGDAETLLLEALTIAERAGLQGEVANIQRSLGWARFALGMVEQALASLESAIAAHRAEKYPRGEADGLAARGLIRCLEGETELGHRDIENAYAIHVFNRDAIRLEKVRELGQMLGLPLATENETGTREERIARLSAVAKEHAAGGRKLREAVVRFQLAQLERDGEVAAPGVESSAQLASPAAAWTFGPESRWVRPPEGAVLDLARHGALRRVLDALVIRRLEAPGNASSADELLEAGWPGERVRHESGMLRVYSVIRRLRALGLGTTVVTRDDGYLLNPEVRVSRAADGTFT